MSAEQKTWDAAIATLRAKQAEARRGGGADRLQKQRDAGRLTAWERVEYLLDPGSFTELHMLAEHRCHDFGMGKKKFLGDGVITGHGTIGGRRVFLSSGDETVLGGSVGKVHGEKIHNIMRLARETKVPVICLNAGGGARIQECMDNVFGVTGMFYQNVMNSGVVPQISAIMGTCAGGNAYSSALCDFVVQVKKDSYVFLAGPGVIKEVTGEVVSSEELGGAKSQSSVSGVVHLTAEDDRDCLDVVKRLLDFLPQNNQERPPARPCADPADREVPELTDIVPIDLSESYDVKTVIRAIADEGNFFETQEAFARNLVVGFARFDGQVAGIVANNPEVLGGCLDLDASDKAARFVRTCDAFNIPLISLVDVPGFLFTVAQEQAGILRHGAKMLYAWAEATVPRIAVIMRQMYGGGIPAMGVHEIGFDQVFAWPAAEMQVVGAAPAVRVLYGRELNRQGSTPAESQALFDRKVREYHDTYLTPYPSSSRSIVDGVIEPKDTRRTIVSALRMLETRTAPARAWRKHGNIPL